MATLNNPKLYTSQMFLTEACHASRKHSEIASAALAKYGNHGAQISGCVRDHFPADVKNELRHWAGEVTRLSGLAYLHKPKRVHFSTIRKLGQEIATRDGSGFYGPQPLHATGIRVLR